MSRRVRSAAARCRLTSANGSVAVNGLIDSVTGGTRISAGTDVNINQLILNGQSGGSLVPWTQAATSTSTRRLTGVVVWPGALSLSPPPQPQRQPVGRDQQRGDRSHRCGRHRNGGSGKGFFSGNASITMQSRRSHNRRRRRRIAHRDVDGRVGEGQRGDRRQHRPGGPQGAARTSRSISRCSIRAAALRSTPRLAATSSSTRRSMDVAARRAERVTLNASRDVAVNSAVVTNNGAISITASNGAANMAQRHGAGFGIRIDRDHRWGRRHDERDQRRIVLGDIERRIGKRQRRDRQQHRPSRSRRQKRREYQSARAEPGYGQFVHRERRATTST